MMILGIPPVPSKPENSLSKSMRLCPLPSLAVTLAKLPGLGTVEFYATKLSRCKQAHGGTQVESPRPSFRAESSTALLWVTPQLGHQHLRLATEGRPGTLCLSAASGVNLNSNQIPMLCRNALDNLGVVRPIGRSLLPTPTPGTQDPLARQSVTSGTNQDPLAQ